MCVNTWNPPCRTPYPHYGAYLVSFYWWVLTWGGPRVGSVHIRCYHFPDSIFLLLSENFINLENYTQIKQKDGPRLETHAWQHYTPLPSKEVECVFHVDTKYLIKKKIIYLLYFWLLWVFTAACRPYCCERELDFLAVGGLIEVASRCWAHRLSSCGSRA